MEGRDPRLTALGLQDDATGKILAAQFFLLETAEGYFRLLHSLLHRFGIPVAFYGDRSGIFTRHDDHWSLDEQLAGQRQPTQFGRALHQLSITFIAAQTPQAKGRIERLWGVLQDRLTGELRLTQASDIAAANSVLRRFVADYNRRFARIPREAKKPGVPRPRIWNASAASPTSASSATTTSCNGTADGCVSLFYGGYSIPISLEGDIFTSLQHRHGNVLVNLSARLIFAPPIQIDEPCFRFLDVLLPAK